MKFLEKKYLIDICVFWNLISSLLKFYVKKEQNNQLCKKILSQIITLLESYFVLFNIDNIWTNPLMGL